MHRNKCLCPNILKGLNNVRRVIVVWFHKPSRFIGTDADQEIIDLGKQFAGFCIMASVPAVSAMINRRLPTFDNIAAPKPLVCIEKPSLRPVSDRNEIN